MDQLTLTPIGYIRTPYIDRYSAPRQPGVAREGMEGVIELIGGSNFEQALHDLEGFERIWVIYWFHRNSGWKPKVLPPRGTDRKRGVFATRSPHRPNALGLSLLRLLDVRGRILRVGDVDLLDGTPIFDIKPYLPYAEAFPESRIGWLDGAGLTRYETRWSALARTQAHWLLQAHGIELQGLVDDILGRDPAPHPYRRIELRPDGARELALRSWRIRFSVEQDIVDIDSIHSGYAASVVASSDPGALHDGRAHAGFHREWPGDS